MCRGSAGRICGRRRALREAERSYLVDASVRRAGQGIASAWRTVRGSRWRMLLWLVPLLAVVLALLVIAARAFSGSDTGQAFLAAYPGHSAPPGGAPTDAPWWLQWQHGLNFFMMILIIRSGWMIHSQQRPEAYWTRNNTGRLTTKRPPTKMSLYLWLHLSLDVAWLANGILFVILLLSTGSWKRVVPAHWDIFPNAASAALQYLSLDWPTESPWANYNALQVLAYAVTIFVAAPLAFLTGLRMSPVWRGTWKVSKIYPVGVARAIHLPVMFYFAAFIVTHVALVFATGMRSNLNYMYSSAAEDSQGWWGFVIFLVTLLVVVAGWIGARPLFMQPVAGRTGRVTSR